MSPKKLTDTDKTEILELYRESGETTSTLSSKYGVSSSTISRFLKANMSESEYEGLIQQKRIARTPNRSQKAAKEPTEVVATAATDKPKKKPVLAEDVKPATATTINDEETKISQQLEIFDQEPEDEDEEELNQVNVFTLEQLLGEDIGDLDEDQEEDEFDEDEDEESQLEANLVKDAYYKIKNEELEILPLSEAPLPKVCYLVIDKGSELITRPLKEFRDLGKIPSSEVQQKTLPIFDNHRIAKRFSNRREKVIKVPDSRLLEKTCSHLQAKGITRILIDGQIYSLQS